MVLYVQCYESQTELFWNLTKEWLTSAVNNVAEFGGNKCVCVIKINIRQWENANISNVCQKSPHCQYGKLCLAREE